MSRIGKLPITLPAGVTVKVDGDNITVKGPKGELSQKFNPELDIKIEGNQLEEIGRAWCRERGEAIV